MRNLPVALALFLGITLAFPVDTYTSARHKIDLLEGGNLRSGARLDLSVGEINAWANHDSPPGVRNAKLVVIDAENISASALVDFGKLRRAQGYDPGWLMSKLLDGERNISASARIRTSGGKVTVDLKQVSISGFNVDGATLEFLIRNFVAPVYPEAVVGQPVPMGLRIDRLQLTPASVAVFIGR